VAIRPITLAAPRASLAPVPFAAQWHELL